MKDERETLLKLLGRAFALMPTDSTPRQQWLRDVLLETDIDVGPAPLGGGRAEEDRLDLAEQVDPYFHELCDVLR